MKIAIIGSGISGLTAAYLLNKQHDITLYESEQRIGGHTATIPVSLESGDYAIDTGFIVFNDWTYPNFIRLMKEIGVQSQATDMGFSVSCELTGLEYGGGDFNALFAQRRNLLNPRHWKMLADILRFNREAIADLDAQRLDPAMTLGEYLQRGGYGQAFTEQYLIPMGSAIWSTSINTMLNFPLLFFVRFFKNHGLLSVNDRPQWRVIRGGSSQYLEPLTQSFAEKIHTNAAIAQVQRHPDHVTVSMSNGQQQHFDQVVIATHSDQALSMLADASDNEREILGAIPYQSNEVVLHTDASLLPAKKVAWSSWNYRLQSRHQRQAVLTYNMNILQGLDAPETFCVTLNATDNIKADTILGRYDYSHPQFSLESIAAAERWSEINGTQRTWYCGAYWANGFHEDGVVSGIRVATALGAQW